MKTIKTVFLALTVLLTATSCSESKKEKSTTKKENVVQEEQKTVALTGVKEIHWTAYKTTAKKPVSGVFKAFEFSPKKGKTITEMLNESQLSIDVSSIDSGNEIRDQRLVNSFFNVMNDTKKLTGTLTMKNDNEGTVSFTMNAITFDLPVVITTGKDSIDITGTMNLDNWAAQAAVKALNKACKGEHKGADGISKTWSEVAVAVKIGYTK